MPVNLFKQEKQSGSEENGLLPEGSLDSPSSSIADGGHLDRWH